MLGISLLFALIPSLKSQDLTGAIMEKLPRNEKYKLMKSVSFTKSGDDMLLKSRKAKEVAKNNNDTADAVLDRMRASFCFRNANGLMYSVLDKEIKNFWESFTGDRNRLSKALVIENLVYDSLKEADKLREFAENEGFYEDKIPFVEKAEIIESHALLRLQKVLYTYMKWPESIPGEWLAKADCTLPAALPDNTAITDSTKQVAGQRSPDQPLRISSEEPPTVGNVSTKTGNRQLNESDMVKLKENVIDSVQKAWRSKMEFKSIYADTSHSIPFHKKSHSDTVTNYFPYRSGVDDAIYKVQIAACRNKMSNSDIQKIYSGNLKVTEVFINGWYKYHVGTFSNYQEACDFKRNVNAKKSFIICYVDGVQTPLSSVFATDTGIRNRAE